MAITIQKYANIAYNYIGETNLAVSNIATTGITEAYSLSASKLSQNANWRPGENLAFMIKVENDGTEPICAISIQDNWEARPFAYLCNGKR